MSEKMGRLWFVFCCLMVMVTSCNPAPIIEVGCSVDDLVKAIQSANSDPDHTTIIFEDGCLYNLTEVDNTIDFQEEFTGDSGNTGLPPISTPITIEGNQSTIQRLDDAPEMRFLFITASGDLTLNEVTLNNGLVQNGQTFQRHGGAIYNRGILNLIQSQVTENYAADSGGGIFNAETGSINIDNSTISFNQAGRHGGAFINGGTLNIEDYSIINNNKAVTGSGGAIMNGGYLSVTDAHINFNQSTVRGGAITSEEGSFTLIDGVLFEGNMVGGGGGGAVYFTEATFTITGSTFTLNQTIEGGASGGAVLISGSDGVIQGETTFLENSSSADGGGVYIIGNSEVILDMVTFKSNTAVQRGGGLSNYSHGMFVNVRNSTFTGNSALSGGGLANGGEISVRKTLISENVSTEGGGGIYNAGTLFKLINSTVSDNSNQSIGGGVLNYGSIQISYVTIAFNQSMHGAGLYDNGDEVQIKNSIVAKNSPYNCSVFGQITAFGDNLDNDGSCQSFNITANPFLKALSPNGGPTLTHAFLFKNPAVDGVSDCTSFAGTSSMTLDQRSFLRPFNSKCDLGAFESMDALPDFQAVIHVDFDMISCYTGPDLESELMTNYFFGENLTAIGRDLGGSWLGIIRDNSPDREIYCWVPSDRIRTSMPILDYPVVHSSDQSTDSPDRGQEFSRCDLFIPEAYSYTQLDIPFGTGDLTLYVTMPGGVPGLEVEIPEENHPWIYSGVLGEYQDQMCTFDGDAERLYCRFSLPEDYFGTVRDFSLYINRCEDPIFNNSLVTIVEPQEPVACTIHISEFECLAAGGTYSCGTSADCECDCPQ